MIYSKEFSIDTFPWWSGAKDTIATVREHGKMAELESLIEENFDYKIPTATEINDFVWHNRNFILAELEIEDDD